MARKKGIRCFVVTCDANDDNYSDEIYVFAESAAKAKYLAWLEEDWGGSQSVGICDDFYRFTVRRCPEADHLYSRGKRALDWYDDDDRRFLVEKCGWSCLEPENADCSSCSCLDVCETGKMIMMEENNR